MRTTSLTGGLSFVLTRRLSFFERVLAHTPKPRKEIHSVCWCVCVCLCESWLFWSVAACWCNPSFSCGCVIFTAPEAFLSNKYSIKSDVWSFGVVLAELVTYGQKPYAGLSNKEVVKQLEEGFRMPKPPGCPDGLYDIMLSCWKTEAEDRPTFESLVFTLEDFFHSTEANYTEVEKVLEEEE
eukprot:m.207333 g.207333  ORF g.207333 m.207333 type:complete len:182 (-) comp26072_c0_seq42:1100-1645(-)